MEVRGGNRSDRKFESSIKAKLETHAFFGMLESDLMLDRKAETGKLDDEIWRVVFIVSGSLLWIKCRQCDLST
jgi:hypothetical protein